MAASCDATRAYRSLGELWRTGGEYVQGIRLLTCERLLRCPAARSIAYPEWARSHIATMPANLRYVRQSQFLRYSRSADRTKCSGRKSVRRPLRLLRGNLR